MNVREKMETIGVLRQENCRGIECRIDTLIKNLQRLNKKMEWAKCAEPDECVNIGTFDVKEFYSQLQMIMNDMVELEKQNAKLELLRDMQ